MTVDNVSTKGSGSRLMTVGELSRRTRVPIKNLREYTDTGLIYTVGRSHSNYRLYTADALGCVRWISLLRGLGLTVGDMDDDHFCLSELALFRDLSRREMAAMAEAAPMRTVPPGEIVYDPTRPVSVLFIVKRGRFRLFRTVADGHAVTTALPGPGAIFGEMDLLGLQMRGTWAEALDGGDLCLMSRADVRHMLLSDARIATRIAEQLGARIGELEDRLADLAYKSVLERVAHRLCVLAGPVPPGTDAETVRLTHGQLAGLIGATRERTTTVLGELAERGLVSLHRGRIRIRDRAGLAAAADGAARAPHRPGGSPRAEEGFPRT